MSVPLAMSNFTAFSTSTGRLTWLLLARSELSALRTALLLRLPVRGAAVVTAQRIGPGLTVSLLERALLHGLRNPLLMSLGGGLAVFSLLRGTPLRRLRFGVVLSLIHI